MSKVLAADQGSFAARGAVADKLRARAFRSFRFDYGAYILFVHTSVCRGKSNSALASAWPARLLEGPSKLRALF
jgi:hypothetical protein